MKRRSRGHASAPIAANQPGPLARHSALNPQPTGAHYNPLASGVPGADDAVQQDPDAMVGMPDDTMNAGGAP